MCVPSRHRRVQLYIRLQINRDSLLSIYCCHRGLKLNPAGDFTPDFTDLKDGHLLLIDDVGGIGAFPYSELRNVEVSEISTKKWKVEYTLNHYSKFFLSIFPPRKFNYEQSFDERIAHHGSIGPWTPPPYPTDDMLEELSKYTNVLVLHEMLWQGKLTRTGKPIDTLDDLILDACFCTHD